MAANRFDVPFSAVACTAATPKTVVGVKAAANVALYVTEAKVSFDGATSSNAPAVVEFGRCTFATNSPGTASTSITLGNTKRDPGRAETIQATAAHTWTTEPTVITAQQPVYEGQYNGIYHYIAPQSAPLIVAGGQGFVVRVTSPNNVNVAGHVSCEE